MTASNLQIMRALIVKDWRLFRLPMISLLTVGAGCYGIAGIAKMFMSREDLLFVTIALAALNFTTILASTFGGMAIAGERSGRTGDFMAMLPVTRMQIIASKWIVSLLMLLPCSALHAGIAIWLGYLGSHAQIYDLRLNLTSFESSVMMWIGCTTALFGCAWAFSTFLTSGPISACASIVLTVVSMLLMAIFLNDYLRCNDWQASVGITAIELMMGLSCLFAGTIYYLRRIAP